MCFLDFLMCVFYLDFWHFGWVWVCPVSLVSVSAFCLCFFCVLGFRDFVSSFICSSWFLLAVGCFLFGFKSDLLMFFLLPFYFCSCCF